jgi:hypothetical protein
MPDQFSPRRRPTRQPPHAAASKHSSDHVGARRRPVELCSDFCIAPSSTEQCECTCHSLSRLCALLSRYGTPHTCTDCNFHDRNAFRSGMMALVHRGMQCAGARWTLLSRTQGDQSWQQHAVPTLPGMAMWRDWMGRADAGVPRAERVVVVRMCVRFS